MDIEKNTQSLLRVGDELGSIMSIVQEFGALTPAVVRPVDQQRRAPRAPVFSNERRRAHVLATGEACHD